MNKILRGRGYRYAFPNGGVGELELVATAGLEGLGFRLVHDGSDRVFRGGSWSRVASDADVAYRYWIDPSYRSNRLGFRLVREEK